MYSDVTSVRNSFKFLLFVEDGLDTYMNVVLKLFKYIWQNSGQTQSRFICIVVTSQYTYLAFKVLIFFALRKSR